MELEESVSLSSDCVYKAGMIFNSRGAGGWVGWASLVAQLGKNLPSLQETWVQSLGWEDSPEEGRGYPLQYSWASLMAQLVKNLPAMQKTWVQSLGWEGPLEKGKATHSSILAWRIPRTVYIVHGVPKSWTRLDDFQSWKHPSVDDELGVSKLRSTIC